MSFHEPVYALLSAVLGFVTLIFAMLTVFFVVAGIRGALNRAIPDSGAKFEAIIACFVVAIALGLAAVVCAHFTRKAIGAASRG